MDELMMKVRELVGPEDALISVTRSQWGVVTNGGRVMVMDVTTCKGLEAIASPLNRELTSWRWRDSVFYEVVAVEVRSLRTCLHKTTYFIVSGSTVLQEACSLEDLREHILTLT